MKMSPPCVAMNMMAGSACESHAGQNVHYTTWALGMLRRECVPSADNNVHLLTKCL